MSALNTDQSQIANRKSKIKNQMTFRAFRQIIRHRRGFEQLEFEIMSKRLIDPRHKNAFPQCVRRLWNIFKPQSQNDEDQKP